MSADAPVVSTTYWTFGQGYVSITVEPPGWVVESLLMIQWLRLLSASGLMRHFLSLCPTSGKAWDSSA